MPTGIYNHKPLSKKHKENIAKALNGNKNGLGYKHTESWKQEQSERLEELWRNGTKKGGWHHTEEAKRKIIKNHRHFQKEETKEKISKALQNNRNGLSSKGMLGKHHSEEWKRKMSEKNKGEKHWNWQGGISSENERIRKCVEIKLWKIAVFQRDNYTCQKCESKKSGNFNAHHIRNFAEIIELRTSIENGITFCKKCHKKFHDKYGYRYNTKEQLLKFLNN